MSESHLRPPAESILLNAAYRKSGLTAADLGVATGLSVGVVRLALSGLRYRQGRPKPTAPPDKTLALLGSALGIQPEALTDLGRHRAAALISDAEYNSVVPAPDATVTIAARAALTRQILAVFSVDELRAEVARRDRLEHAAPDQEDLDDTSAACEPLQLPTERENTPS